MLNYITDSDLRSLDEFSHWQGLKNSLREKRLLCTSCGSICENLTLNSFSNPKVCLVEFHSNENLTFAEETNFQGQKHILKGLVQNNGVHFMCAVSDNEK